ENEGGVAIYQNGKSIGSMGINSEFQGGAITGNATSIFTALQYGTPDGTGSVVRYNRATRTRDLVIHVSVWDALPRGD
ncbi:SMP-30/gluconolaconase/LRE-like region family protein, partial [Burkholderia sp. SIMBA_042]